MISFLQHFEVEKNGNHFPMHFVLILIKNPLLNVDQ